MLIAGTSYNVNQWPEPITRPAISWKRLSTGYWQGYDRGAAQDVYEGRVRIADKTATLDALQATLDANRNGITLSSFSTGEHIFGSNVDYSGSISATVVDFGLRRNVMFRSIFELEITFRALSPSLLAVTPSLANLRLQEGWDGDRSTEVTKHFSYNQSASYIDHGSDVGLFKATFRQTSEEIKAIRAYLLTTARAESIEFPEVLSDFYPYGAMETHSMYQKCHVKEWRDKRINFVFWDLEITFAQATPYFSAGIDASDTVTDLLTPGTSGTPDTIGTPGG